MVTFWLILIVAESVGAIVGFATELFFDTVIHSRRHRLFFPVGVACTMALELASEHRRRRVTWLIVLLGAASLSLQVAHAYGLIPLPIPVDPWFLDRLRGWSHDPNQLGLVAALLTVISIHLADTATARVKMIAAAACAVLAFSVGVLTKSNSFTMGILAAGAVFLAIKSSLWLATFKRGLTFRAALVSLALLGLPVLAVGALPLAPAVVDRLEAKSEALYNEDNQGDLRFHLWAEAFDKGMGAAMLGLGPGPHLTKKVMEAFTPRQVRGPQHSSRSVCPGRAVGTSCYRLALCVAASRDHESEASGSGGALLRLRRIQHVPLHHPPSNLLVRSRPLPPGSCLRLEALVWWKDTRM